jgi:hypothetical protein
MKNIFLFTMMLALSITITNANVIALIEVAPEIKAAFQRQFPGATLAAWEAVPNTNVYAVRFVNDNRTQLAYFTDEATYVGTLRLANLSQLPAAVTKAVSGLLKDSELLKAEELLIDDARSYFFETLKDGRKQVIEVKSSGKVVSIKKSSPSKNF